MKSVYLYKLLNIATFTSSSHTSSTEETQVCTIMSKTKLFSFEVTKKTTIFEFSSNNRSTSVDRRRRTIEMCDDKTAIDAVMSYIKQAGATADIDSLIQILGQCSAYQLSQIEIASTNIIADLSSATDGLWNHLFIQRFGFQSAYLLVEKMEQGEHVSIHWKQIYDESAEAEKKPKYERKDKSTTSSPRFNPIKKVFNKSVDLFRKSGRHAGRGKGEAEGEGEGEEETPLHPATVLGHLDLATGFSSHGPTAGKYMEDHPQFVYPPIEVKQNIIKLHPMIKWEDPPKYIWCKLQVDGAVVTGTLPKQAGAGGVLTRGDGKYVAAFSYHLTDVSLKYAKLWALWYGLVLAEEMKVEYLIVETDSMFVADTLNWKGNPVDGFHSNFQKMINDYRNILPDNCTLQMITTESNAIARIYAERGAANK